MCVCLYVRDGEREIKFLHIISKFVVFVSPTNTQWTSPDPLPLSLPVSLRLQGVEYPVNRSQTAENYLDILENHLKNTSASMKENK